MDEKNGPNARESKQNQSIMNAIAVLSHGLLLQMVESVDYLEFQNEGPNIFLLLLVLAAVVVIAVVVCCAILLACILLLALLIALFTGMTVSATLTGWAKGKISVGMMMFFVQCGVLSGAVIGTSLGAAFSLVSDKSWWNVHITLPSGIICAVLGAAASWGTVHLWLRLLKKLHSWWVSRKTNG
jgi:MFS family permease